MRRLDDFPIDPEIAAQLDAIDATLAGEPVDPEHAELAELALLLAAERPSPAPAFAHSLDERVARRFAAPASAGAPRRRGWSLKPAIGVAAGGVAAVVVVVVVASSGGSGVQRSLTEPAALPRPATTTSAATVPKPGFGAVGAAGAGGAAGSGAAGAASSGTSAGAASSGTSGAATSGLPTPAQPTPGALQPPPNGRKITQSAQLGLTTAPSRIDEVAQEVFNVIGRENGVVNRSDVTATGGSDGYAEFQLSVPSSVLPDTMASLSKLRYAHVVSRTDTTQDVNNAYVAATARLADARALRTALLKQLANATTQAQIDSLNAQIHDAEASIASDQAALRAMNRQINTSQINLTLNAAPLPIAHGTSSFTIGKAAHDAGRVLTVAAGVALITLAALVPVALVGALAWWIAGAVRRRRREQALDMA